MVTTQLNFETWKQGVFSAAELADSSVSSASAFYQGGQYNNYQVFAQGFTPSEPMGVRIASFPIQNSSGKPVFGFFLSNTAAVDYALQQSADMGIDDEWVDVPSLILQRSTQGGRDTIFIEPNELPLSNDYYRIHFFPLEP